MLRLSSIFSRHLADLQRRSGQLETAATTVEFAIGTALKSEQRDVLWACRLSQVRIASAHREAGLSHPSLRHLESGQIVESALQYARSMGSYKLEVEALRIQAEIMLEQGDRVLAGSLAARSAAVANRCGLRLMKISALSTYGEALVRRQQYELAGKILREAQREAERRGYQSLAGALLNQLEQIPVGVNREP